LMNQASCQTLVYLKGAVDASLIESMSAGWSKNTPGSI
jgi:hypothetical protein